MKYVILIILVFILADFKIIIKASEIPAIYISEILPDGDGADAGKEWIEVYSNLAEPLNLKNYYFVNRSLTGTERKVTITSSLNIPPQQYFLISEGAQNIASENILILGSGKINMFNDESDLELYDPDGALIDKVHYLKPLETKSLERKGPLNILDCSKLVTNSNGNTILTDNSARDPICFGQTPISSPVVIPKDSCISIGLISSNLADSTICIRGVLTVEPDILGDKIFYIIDGGLGFKIKLKTTSSITLKSGDKVEISGTLKSIKDGLYLYADSLKLLNQNNVLYPTALNNLKLQKHSFVEYIGEIMKNYSKSMDLEFGDSTIRVSILASTDISMPTRTVGDKLKVKGILVEESGIFKILPRYQEDLEIVEEELASSKIETIKEKSSTSTANVKSVSSKLVSNIVLNKLPSLSLNKIQSSGESLYKYKISRSWFILILFVFFIITLALILRKSIIKFFKKLKFIELRTIDPEAISAQVIDFEKDKYELMFGDSS